MGWVGNAHAVTPSDHCTNRPSLSRCMCSNLPWTRQEDRDRKSMYGRVHSPLGAHLEIARGTFFADATQCLTMCSVESR